MECPNCHVEMQPASRSNVYRCQKCGNWFGVFAHQEPDFDPDDTDEFEVMSDLDDLDQREYDRYDDYGE